MPDLERHLSAGFDHAAVQHNVTGRKRHGLCFKAWFGRLGCDVYGWSLDRDRYVPDFDRRLVPRRLDTIVDLGDEFRGLGSQWFG